MMHYARDRMVITNDERSEACGEEASVSSMWQTRHSPSEAIDRILAQVAVRHGLQDNAAGRALVADLQHRLLLTVTLSGALLGPQHGGTALAGRLETTARCLVALRSEPGQHIDLRVEIRGNVPDALDDLLVRVADELVENAVSHGMRGRGTGWVELLVASTPDRVVMQVADDGWGPGDNCKRGPGLLIAHLLAGQHGSGLVLAREPGRTVATLTVPLDAALERRS